LTQKRRAVEQLSSAIGGGARALVRQPKTAVFFAKIANTTQTPKRKYQMSQMLSSKEPHLARKP